MLGIKTHQIGYLEESMEYSEQFYSSVLENMINGFAYHKIITDENNTPIDYEFLDVNIEFEKLTGLKKENVIGRRVTQVLPGIESSEFNWIEFYGSVALNGTKEKFTQYSDELGRWYIVYVYSNIKNHFITIFNDISELKLKEQVLTAQNDEISALYEEIVATEEELRKQFNEIQLHKEYMKLSEEKYKALADNSQDIIYSCTVDGVITAVNKKFCEISGLSSDKIIGSDISVLIKSKRDIKIWNKILKSIKENGVKRETEIEYTSNEGLHHIYSIVLTPLFDINNKIIGITGTNHDITQIRENEQTVGHLAYYDSLTDLPNRLLFNDSLKVAMHQAKRRAQKVGVIFLDFDNFKKINDTLGHFIGDEVIKVVSKELKRVLKKNETLARFSGDEFAVFIENIYDRDDILGFIDRLISVFRNSFVIEGNSLYMSSSIGISMYPEDGDSVDELLRNADTAMYKAKESGKGHYQFFNSHMKEEAFKKLKIEGCLCNALENNELNLYYQPIFKSKTGKVRGYEALIRWECQDIGMLSPDEFIPIAEETGLIIPIGEWVLRTACEKNKEWQDKYGFKTIVAVNISALQLKHTNFVEMVKSILNETGLSPEFLELEITESILIDSFEIIAQILGTLKNIGVQISLDDFGTGYSSLNYLTDLPLDTLKIDKIFIHRIKEGSNEKAILASIMSLAHNLDLEIIAEGVETKDQLEYLIQSNCDNLQGYLLCKPIKENELLNLIRNGKIELPNDA